MVKLVCFRIAACACAHPRRPPVTCSAKSRNRESTPCRPQLHRRPSVSNATAPLLIMFVDHATATQLGVSRSEEIQLRYADLCISITVSFPNCPRFFGQPEVAQLGSVSMVYFDPGQNFSRTSPLFFGYTISFPGCVFGEQRGGDAETLSRIGVDHEN